MNICELRINGEQGSFSHVGQALLLALVLVKLRNTCKKEMNRKKLERPNICYIFEKLVVQGWQIWHSQVSIPFNSSPQCKKALYVIIAGEMLSITILFMENRIMSPNLGQQRNFGLVDFKSMCTNPFCSLLQHDFTYPECFLKNMLSFSLWGLTVCEN